MLLLDVYPSRSLYIFSILEIPCVGSLQIITYHNISKDSVILEELCPYHVIVIGHHMNHINVNHMNHINMNVIISVPFDILFLNSLAYDFNAIVTHMGVFLCLRSSLIFLPISLFFLNFLVDSILETP